MSEEIKNLEGALTFNGRPIMTPSRAKEVLEFMNVNISIAELRKGTSLYVDSFNSHAMLNGAFHPDQLQAIALWMQDPEGVTNA